MSLRGNQNRFIYSNAVNSTTAQGDPLISLGGLRPDNDTPQGSECYRGAVLDGNSPSLTVYIDNETDTPGSSDPAIDDWLVATLGPAAPSFGRVVAVDYGARTITVDRAMRSLALTGGAIRTSRRQNLFPDATLAQVQSGVVDHRMIYFLKTNVGAENNFRFWVNPIQANGCDIEIVAPQNVILDPGGTNNVGADSTIATATDSPFNSLGRIATTSSDWNTANAPRIVYSEAAAVPDGGSDAFTDEACIPIWIRRTIPANASPGECVFLLNAFVPNAIAQDATADPNPHTSGFIFSWFNPEPTYTLTITSDRLLFTGGVARIFGTVKYPDGTPAVGLNARLSLVSGPGTLTADPDARTDSLGRVSALYASPATAGVNPLFRIDVPTSARV